MTQKKVFSGFLGGMLGGAAQDFLSNLVSGFSKEGVDVVKKKIEKALAQNPRADFVKTFASLNENDEKKILYLFSEAKANKKEKELAIILLGLLPRKEDGTLDEERAKESLTHLVQSTEQEPLYAVIEGMIKSSTWNQIKEEAGNFLDQVVFIAEEALVAVSGIAGSIFKNIRALDNVAEEKAKEMDSHGFGWLAKKLFR